MKKIEPVFLNLSILSASVVCFEILSTRITSVIYVQNYAFIILSLAILGLGGGGIFSFFKIKLDDSNEVQFSKSLFKYFLVAAASLIFFVFSVTLFGIINPYINFLLLALPFCVSGIIYAQIFRWFSQFSFKLYASDLIGAASGSILSLFIINWFDASNAVILISLILFALAGCNTLKWLQKKFVIAYATVVLSLIILCCSFGKDYILGPVPIGYYPEKDIYYTYSDSNIESKIIDSRWSINGRSDLVEYNNQNIVKHLFIDGSAGSQMFRFNGNIASHDPMLNKLLLEFTTAIPFLFLNENEKDNMLIIGPGGGKEVLTGLLGGIKKITGIEVNNDFVDIVKGYRKYNGGIYTDFPNVNIVVEEGRHYVKRTDQKYDILLMALPSTEQLQSIENLASNENYLLTVEAIKDYLKILTAEGELIFTVHNKWELVRLITTTIYALNELGINNSEALNHFIVLGTEYAPTIVVKKNSFTEREIARIQNTVNALPKNFPPITYLPYNWQKVNNSIENVLLKTIYNNNISLRDYIKRDPYDISPVRDNSPYFYKVTRSIPDDYIKLMMAVICISIVVVSAPFIFNRRRKYDKGEKRMQIFTLSIFVLIGIGFMILEVSLFQQMILYLGSPTISLSILLTSLLIGMGTGSFFGWNIYSDDTIKRIKHTTFLIVFFGIGLSLISPVILDKLLIYSRLIRSIACFLLIFPIAFLLGIPFPSAIKLLKQNRLEKYIPWMYGVNGIASVLGSILAFILSMIIGFTNTLFVGLCFYFIIYVLLNISKISAAMKS